LNIAKVISSTNNEHRSVTVSGWGKGFARTPTEVGPFGVDSSPIPGMQAAYNETSMSGAPVLLGYVNISALAQPGEYRQYSTDTDGNLMGEIWLHNTGLISIKNQEQSLLTNLQNLINHLSSFMTNVNTGFADLFATIGSPPPSVNADIVLNIADIAEDLANLEQLLQ